MAAARHPVPLSSRARWRWLRALVLGQVAVLAAAVTVALPSADDPEPLPQLAREDRAFLTPLPIAPVVVPSPAPLVAAPREGTAAGRVPRAVRASREERPPAPSVEQRGQAALESLGYPWQDLGYAIRFRAYTGGLLGLTDPRAREITVYVRPRGSDLELRATVAHELGHALDLVLGSERRRAEYRRIRQLPTTGRWFPCASCDDLASPAGDWAEVFAASLVGSGDFRSRLAGPPTPGQLERLREVFSLSRQDLPGRDQSAPQGSPSPTPTPIHLVPDLPGAPPA